MPALSGRAGGTGGGSVPSPAPPALPGPLPAVHGMGSAADSLLPRHRETPATQARSPRDRNSAILKRKRHFLLFRADRGLRMKQLVAEGASARAARPRLPALSRTRWARSPSEPLGAPILLLLLDGCGGRQGLPVLGHRGQWPGSVRLGGSPSSEGPGGCGWVGAECRELGKCCSSPAPPPALGCRGACRREGAWRDPPAGEQGPGLSSPSPPAPPHPLRPRQRSPRAEVAGVP